MMLDRDPAKRPSAEEILNKHLLSDMEIQLKLERQMNDNLKTKIIQYEEKLKIVRKGSF